MPEKNLNLLPGFYSHYGNWLPGGGLSPKVLNELVKKLPGLEIEVKVHPVNSQVKIRPVVHFLILPDKRTRK